MACQDCYDIHGRLTTIADENFGPFETLPNERLLTIIENECASLRHRAERAEALLREYLHCVETCQECWDFNKQKDLNARANALLGKAE